jgi:hypothetical protein
MSGGTNVFDGSPYQKRIRGELIKWLNDRAPSFTDGYLAAIRLLNTPEFPARVHLVCHLVRDIYRHLPAALGVKGASRPAEIFPGMVKTLAEQWENSPPSEVLCSNSADGVNFDVRVSTQVYRCLTKLVATSQEMAKHKSTVGKELAVVLFRSGDRREDEFIDPWIIESFDSEYNFFVGRAHLVKSLDRVPTDDGLFAHFEAFERAFHSLVGSYFTGKEELDAILQDTNTATD